jgi:hypothetical protein
VTAGPDYFAEHGNDMIPVRLIDLACVVARLRQVLDEGHETDSLIEERIFTCDLPRLEGWLPAQALREMDL